MTKKEQTTIKILLAGEGGQGVQTVAKIITEASARSGKEVLYIPYFGVEQRGTPSISFITVSDKPIHYPRFKTADIAVVVITRAIEKASEYISPNTEVIFDSSTTDHTKFHKRMARIMAIPATKIAKEKYSQKAFNMIMLGTLARRLNLNINIVWEVAEENLMEKLKNKEVKENNRQALIFGYEAAFEVGRFSKPIFETKKSKNIYKNSERHGEIFPSLCKGCGICIEKCPVKALSFGEDLGVFAFPVPKIDINTCIACGNCRRFCPDGAIGVEKS